MKQSRDPFEAALEEEEQQQQQQQQQHQHQDEDDNDEDEQNPSSPPDSPHASTAVAVQPPADDEDYDDYLDPSADDPQPQAPESTQTAAAVSASGRVVGSREKRKRVEKEEEDEEENVDVELRKCSSTADPHKMAKMQSILSQFTEEQMSRYESFRRSVFQKSNMKKLLMNAAGTQKVSMPMTIVVSGIAKMFVGELVETARMVMTERKDTGPIRPCHIRESYRRLKLEGKIPKRSVPRLFR